MRTSPHRRRRPAAALLAAALLLTGAAVAPTAEAAEPAPRIMPLGDSITHGADVPGAYRVELHRRLAARGHQFDLVGSLQAGPATLPDLDHEGHRGWRIDQLAAEVETWLAASTPDVVVLLIGTNDVIQGFQLAGAPSRLGALVDQIQQARPGTAVLVSSIPPLADAAQNRAVGTYNAALPGIVRQRADRGQPVAFVDAGSAVTTGLLYDGIHPTAEGHVRIAAAVDAGLQRYFSPGFADTVGHTHEDSIDAVAGARVAAGFADGTYRPDAVVSREQMAAFLARALGLPPGPTGRFPDAVGSTHERSISAIAAAGITTGYPDGSFRPGEPVTRGQMATFLQGAFDLPAGGATPYTDAEGTHAAGIRAVHAAGVARGYADDTFRPGLAVTRAQMASFLARALELV